jgi:hypothetical protein
MHESTIMTVRLIGKLEDGTVFDRRGHDGEEPFEFTIDEGYIILAVYANPPFLFSFENFTRYIRGLPPILAFVSTVKHISTTQMVGFGSRYKSTSSWK